MRVLRFSIKFVLVFAVLVIIARFVFPLPSLEGRNTSSSLPISTESSQFGQAIVPLMQQHPGLSGVYALQSGGEAYAARIALARAAQTSLDVRYYIWQRDLTGLPLLAELRDAAQRGVRVRLLVDDNGTPDLDAELSALNALPNMEVRIFNPFTLRTPRLASYLFDFPRLNRRMHNKSFSADGAATIVGGRNIGDIYFARDESTQYSDFDVLAVGQAAQDVALDFDLYWNSDSAYPHERIVSPVADGMARFETALQEAQAEQGAERYRQAIAQTNLAQQLRDGSLSLNWVKATLVSDDPAKGLGQASRDQLMIVRLAAIVARAETSLNLISAYFIPGKDGVEALALAAQSGVRTRTLTNAYEATDVVPVHASYMKYREALVDAGVEVYELKRNQGEAEAKALGLLGSSAASLHAKTVSIDGASAFVGSFNFDPRSVWLNCEMGLLIEDPELAEIVTRSFEADLSRTAWHVSRAEDGRLQWRTEDQNGQAVTTFDEPGVGPIARVMLWVMAILPVEWMM